MSAKSKNSSQNPSSINKPFDSSVWSKANRVASSYRLVLEESKELGYMATSVEIPTVFADGPDANQCVHAARQALRVAVASMLEQGLRPPTARDSRTVQLNIRLTADEKFALEEAASQLGFKGAADYVRAAALMRNQTNAMVDTQNDVGGHGNSHNGSRKKRQLKSKKNHGLPSARTDLRKEDRVKAWLAWTASHRNLGIIIDDSRESIYAGRGE